MGTAGAGYGRGDTLDWMGDVPTSAVAYYGSPQTIAVMAKAVLEDDQHFETRQLCEALCEGLDSKDYTSEYLALYHGVLQHTRYMRDPRKQELVRAPWIVARMILDGHRPNIDCDDMATLLAAMDIAVGGQPEFVTVAFTDAFYDGERQYSHVFTRVLDPRSRCRIVQDPVAAENTPKMLRRVRAACVYPITA
jgi:hypothetical protein